MSPPSPLRQRLQTALVLGPLALAGVLWLPTPGFAIALGLVTLMAAWEWGQLAGLTRKGELAVYLACIGILLFGFWLVPGLRPWFMGAAVLWWLFQAVHIARVREIHPGASLRLGELGAGALVLVAPWTALLELHQVDSQGPLLVLFLMILVWSADSLAYFVGRRFGRTRLAPRVSPGKTREGVYGALLGALLLGAIFGWARAFDWSGILMAILLCGVTVLLSVVGDLYESLLKRRSGVKDSSRLLPGHGGLLDRVDSLTAAAPVFVLGLLLIGGPP